MLIVPYAVFLENPGAARFYVELQKLAKKDEYKGGILRISGSYADLQKMSPVLGNIETIKKYLTALWKLKMIYIHHRGFAGQKLKVRYVGPISRDKKSVIQTIYLIYEPCAEDIALSEELLKTVADRNEKKWNDFHHEIGNHLR